MTEDKRTAKNTALWLVLLAAAGTFALTMGTRQTMGLFLSPLFVIPLTWLKQKQGGFES
jgi:hypothetical protein